MTKAIILLAGKGSRLKNYTDNNHKALIKFNKMNFFEHQINVLNYFNISNITILLGHKSNLFEKYKLNKIINLKFRTTNMVYSLFKAVKIIKNCKEDLIISYGDIVYNKIVLRKLLKSKKEISVIIDKEWKNLWRMRFKNVYDNAETCVIKNYKIVEIGKKSKDKRKFHGQYIGLIKINKKKINEFYEILKKFASTKNFRKSFMTDFLVYLIQNNFNLSPIYIKRNWLELDTIKDLRLYRGEKIINKFRLL